MYLTKCSQGEPSQDEPSQGQPYFISLKVIFYSGFYLFTAKVFKCVSMVSGVQHK